MYNTRVFDYFYNCLRKACLYFSLPTSHQNLSLYERDKRSTSLKAKEIEYQSRSESTNSGKPKGSVAQGKGDLVGINSNLECKQEKNQSEEKISENVNMAESCLVRASSAETRTNTHSVSETADVLDKVSDAEEQESSDLIEVCGNKEEVTVSQASQDDLTLENTEAEDVVKSVENEEQVITQGNTVDELTSSTEESTDASILEHPFIEECRLEDEKCKKGEEKLGEDTGVDELVKDLSDLAVSNDGGCSKILGRKEVNTCDCDRMNSKMTGVESRSQGGIEEGTELAHAAKFCDSRSVSNNNTDTGTACESDEPGAKESKVAADAFIQTHMVAVKEIEHKGDNSVASEGAFSDKSGESSSDSESEDEIDSPVSSPAMARKNRVSSPVGAEYNFDFTAETLTDGKVSAQV